MVRRIGLAALAVCFVCAAGCSVIDKRKAAYEQSRPEKPLETPPDLVSINASDDLVVSTAPIGGAVMLSEYNRGAEVSPKAAPEPVPVDQQAPVSVGPKFGPDLKLARDGAQRWLEVTGAPELWWGKVKSFWEQQGLNVEKESPEIGVIQTEWREDRGGVPVTSLFKKAFSLLYSNSTRDQYIVRFDEVSPGATEIHIAHRGMQQVVEGESVRWVPRQSDPELEVEMLKRMALFMGASEGQAQEIALDAATPEEFAAIQFDDEGRVHLTLALDFQRAWRRVGNALARLDVELDDFDRTKGVYYATGELEVEPTEQGWFKRFLAGGTRLERMEFRLVIASSDGNNSQVVMLDAKGEPMDNKRAEAFFKRLKDELAR